MRAVKLSKKVHKWLALAVGIQFFLWALSGFYMVVVNIDIIHGDMLVKPQKSTLTNTTIGSTLPISQIIDQFPVADALTLQSMAGRPVYLIKNGGENLLLDAFTAKQLSPLTQIQAQQIAEYHYAGDGQIKSLTLIEDNPPGEIRFMALPVWRVDFDDIWSSSFYIDPASGRFSKRRHTLWRVFDFLWMLHIMDYDERENINNTILQVVTVLGTVSGISGIWLLFYSFRRKETEQIAK